MKKFPMLTTVLAASVLTLSTTACRTTVEIETQFIVPELDFPIFPNPQGFVELDEETETVRMPLDFYARIYEYKIRVDEAEAVYSRIKDLYTGGDSLPSGKVDD